MGAGGCGVRGCGGVIVPAVDPVSWRAQTTPDLLAVVDAATDERLNYRAYDRRVDRLAAGIEALGADRLAVLLENRPAVPALAFAAMRTGTSLSILNRREAVPELARRVERVDADALVCGADTGWRARELSAASGLTPVVSIDDPEEAGTSPGPDGSPDPAREVAAFPAPGEWGGEPATDPDRTVLVAFTSGSSGRPKGVRLTAGNLLASATASAFRLGVEPDDRWLTPLSMCHVGGLAPAIRSALYGTTVVIARGFDAEGTARTIDRRGVTSVSLVPTALRRLLETGWSPPASLRFVLLGGAPASPELLARALDRGVPVYPTYGTTETASQIATATPTEAADHPESVGRPLAFTDVTIVDDGRPVGPGEVGEVVVSGPTVTPGYLDSSRTAAATGEFGLHTGDLGRRDRSGRLWIVGRLSDRIVTGGENVDPATVADALATHPAVADVAVVGIPDPEWGQRVAALVVPDGDRPSADALREWCDGRIAGFKRPKTVGYASDLPRTASGTVDREAVRDRLAAERR